MYMCDFKSLLTQAYFFIFLQAILTYWVSTNFISLAQTGLLKIPSIRKALDMPVRIKHTTVKSNKKFVEEFRNCKYYIV